MKRLTVDWEAASVTEETDTGTVTHAFNTPEAFQAVSSVWLRCGWDTKYVYGFTWLGRPIIQLPEDLMCIQEVICAVRPDVIVETGIAHGGSLVFYAGICRLLERGRVIGIDVEIRPPNRLAIENHPLGSMITLIEGDSIHPDTVQRVKSLIRPDETVLVLLDALHTKDHVMEELRAYAPLVSIGSYIVAMDGIMALVAGGPRTSPDWVWNNPSEAAREFAAAQPGFSLQEPPRAFNEGLISERVTYWPRAFLRRTA
jgi:cephalosporin hydroxylase